MELSELHNEFDAPKRLSISLSLIAAFKEGLNPRKSKNKKSVFEANSKGRKRQKF
jgi:hypothetical protein